MSSSNGIKMGVDAVMDKDLYQSSSKKSGEYVSSINPGGEDSDSDDTMPSNRGGGASHSQSHPTGPADEEAADFDPMSVKHRQIQSKNNEYQNRQFDRGYTPARSDPFAQAVQQSNNNRPPSSAKPTLSESRKAVVNDEPRSYRDIMQMQQVQKEKQEAIDVIAGKRSRFSDQTANSEHADGVPASSSSSNLGKRKFEDSDNAATPGPRKRRRWDSTPAPASSSWEETPHVAVAMTPIVGSRTPGMTPGMTPGGGGGAGTPHHGARTPGLGWNATPSMGATPGARTPGLGYTPGLTPRTNRWDATPRPANKRNASTPGTAFGGTPYGMTPRGGTKWDNTPLAVDGARTPTAGRFGGTPLATPGTVAVGGMMTPRLSEATPATPEQFQNLRIQSEINQRNQPLTDEDIEYLLEDIKGYRIVEPPPGYEPRLSAVRQSRMQMMGATPTPFADAERGGFHVPSSEGVGGTTQRERDAAMAGYAVPSDPTLPAIKPEDASYFGQLMAVRDEDIDNLEAFEKTEEGKKRKILKLILKVKNGSPPQRKSALRQLSDRACWFGAGPLLDCILPLLMSPTLEDQERHLLVKVIDRILYKLDDLVRPYVHKILVVIEPLLIDEDYYARVEGREIIANLSKAAGLATMISVMRPDIDNQDEYVRNTTARAFSVVASSLGIPVLLPFLKAVCQSKKSWEARHTGIKIIQQIAILMGCAVLPHLRELVEAIELGLEDEQSKVRTITALALAALAEASSPFGIEAFDSVLRPLWHGISLHKGKTRAAFLKCIGFIIPLMDEEYASYYTREVMPQLMAEFATPDEEMKKIVLKVVKQCVATAGVERAYIIHYVLPDFFAAFWNRRMAMDRRNYKQLVETTSYISVKIGCYHIVSRIVDDLRDENELYRKMVIETIDRVLYLNDNYTDDIDDKLEEQLIDGILYVFSEQHSDDMTGSSGGAATTDLVVLNGIGRVLISLGIRCKPYLPQICGLIKHRLLSSSTRIRQEACDLISRIAAVIYECNEMALLKHLASVLDELLGEEYPDVLGSILLALKNIITVIGIKEFGGVKIKDLLPKLTPIMKNRHEKVQENCIDLIGKIADFAADYVSPREWMRISYELLDILKAHKKSIRRCAVNTFGYISKAIGPQDIIEILLNNLRVQERQNRICTTVAIAIVAEQCSPFTVLAHLLNEYRVPELNVQNGILKSLSFLFEYIHNESSNFLYVFPTLSLLQDALSDRDLVHRQTACSCIKHLSLGLLSHFNHMGSTQDALQHLLNFVWPNIFETSPHLVQAVNEAIDSLRCSLGSPIIFQYLLQGLFHPARRVRVIYWRIYNNLYLGNQDSLTMSYPHFKRRPNQTAREHQKYVRHELLYFV